MTEGAYKGKTISLLTGVDGNSLIKDMVSTDPNKMHTITLGATGSCWTRSRMWCSDVASTNTVQLATDIELKRSNHRNGPTVLAFGLAGYTAPINRNQFS